jgi:hypothetical protein
VNAASVEESKSKTHLILFQSTEFRYKPRIRVLSRNSRPVRYKSVFAKEAKTDKTENRQRELIQGFPRVYDSDVRSPHGQNFVVLVYLIRGNEEIFLARCPIFTDIPGLHSFVLTADPTIPSQACLDLISRAEQDNLQAEDLSQDIRVFPE